MLVSAGRDDHRKTANFRNIEYDLKSPDVTYLLPAELREISGITALDESSIASVQDERGTVFIQNLEKNEIVKRINFGPPGDYEDIARVGDKFYVVRSNKILTEIENLKTGNIITKNYALELRGFDVEGMCYDQNNNRLLVLPKQFVTDDKDKRDKRYIYAFDRSSGRLLKDPVISFDLHEIGKFCMDNDIKIPMKDKKKGKKPEPDIKFRISAIGISPVTNKLFIVSGMERLIFVSDMNGNIEYVSGLRHDLFPQPEGITFMKNGDMLISNEGRSGTATILRFYRHPGPSR